MFSIGINIFVLYAGKAHVLSDVDTGCLETRLKTPQPSHTIRNILSRLILSNGNQEHNLGMNGVAPAYSSSELKGRKCKK